MPFYREHNQNQYKPTFFFSCLKLVLQIFQNYLNRFLRVWVNWYNLSRFNWWKIICMIIRNLSIQRFSICKIQTVQSTNNTTALILTYFTHTIFICKEDLYLWVTLNILNENSFETFSKIFCCFLNLYGRNMSLFNISSILLILFT